MDVEKIRKEIFERGSVPVRQLARKYGISPDKLVTKLRGGRIELVLKAGKAYLVVVA